MAIGKPSLKPRIDTSRERAEEAIISRAGARPVGRPKVDIKSQPTVIRFKPELLARIDEMARKRGVSRAALISAVVSRAIEEGTV